MYFVSLKIYQNFYLNQDTAIPPIPVVVKHRNPNQADFTMIKCHGNHNRVL